MEISTITDLALWVQMRCPGASDKLAAEALKSATNEFLRKSEILTEAVDIETVKDQAEYDLTLTTPDMGIFRIDSLVYVDDDEKVSERPEDCRTYRLDMENQQLVYEQDYVPAVADYTYRVTCILIPIWRTNDLPTWILKRWGKGIAAGAVKEILTIPPFSEKAQSGFFDLMNNEYRRTCNEAYVEARTKGTRRSCSIGG